MHTISSYRGNGPTNTHTHKQTHSQDRLQYTAPQLARSVKISLLCDWLPCDFMLPECKVYVSCYRTLCWYFKTDICNVRYVGSWKCLNGSFTVTTNFDQSSADLEQFATEHCGWNASDGELNFARAFSGSGGSEKEGPGGANYFKHMVENGELFTPAVASIASWWRCPWCLDSFHPDGWTFGREHSWSSVPSLPVGRQEGHPACKNLGVGLLVITTWLQLCTSVYSSSCHHHFPSPLEE